MDSVMEYCRNHSTWFKSVLLASAEHISVGNPITVPIVCHSAKPVLRILSEKSLVWATIFSLFPAIQEKTMAMPFEALLLWGHAITVITWPVTAHSPGQHILQCPGFRARFQVLQNSESQMFMLWLITLSVQDSHWRKEIETAQRYKKLVCLSKGWLNAKQNGQGAAESFRLSAPYEIQTHVAWLTETRLNH